MYRNSREMERNNFAKSNKSVVKEMPIHCNMGSYSYYLYIRKFLDVSVARQSNENTFVMIEIECKYIIKYDSLC